MITSVCQCAALHLPMSRVVQSVIALKFAENLGQKPYSLVQVTSEDSSYWMLGLH